MAERSLQEFVSEVNGDSRLRIEHDFGDGFVRLRTSEADRRQAAQDIRCSEDVVLELLRNSRDAHASHVFMAVSKEGSRRTVTVVDDGDGIPVAMHELVFEPRVTSKLDTSHKDAWGYHGRGMALFSIAQNAVSAEVCDSESQRGCSLSVVTDTAKVPEKADQSSFPRFVMGEEGGVNVRGPKNILRTACEFAIEARDECAVYVGSPAEIAATLHAFGMATLSAIDRAFCKDRSALPVAKRLATASDPDDFATLAAEIGIDVSPRTARRILDGQIDDVLSLLEQIEIERPGKPEKKGRGASGPRTHKAKVQCDDVAKLVDSVRAAFEPIAEQYYLDGNVEPRVRVSRDRLTITIPLVEKP